jgi:hypothetical protein
MAGLACAQTPATVAFQVPRIAVLDFYGLHKVSENKVRQVLGAREGDPLPASKGATEEKLDAISGVVESHLEAVCCEHGNTILYVGIEERGSPHFELRDAPEGEAMLSDEISSTYRRFMDAFSAAVRKGSTDEDLTAGHSRLADPSARAVQDMFPELARTHLDELRNVLRNSADEDQRAMAAYIIAYAPKKADILDDVQFALRDADPGVRANATEAMIALMVLARNDPSQHLKIESTWFIEMLNSLSWSDRNRAVRALQTLTDSGDPEVLQQLRERALPALIEMARWKTLKHALPAYVLIGRIAGMSQAEIERAWNRGDREAVIVAATKKKK